MRRKQSGRSKRSSQRLSGLIILASASRTCTFIYALICVLVRIHLLIHHLVCLCFSSFTSTLGKHYGLIIPDFANGVINEQLKRGCVTLGGAAASRLSHHKWSIFAMTGVGSDLRQRGHASPGLTTEPPLI